jgi:hypothetical protein
MGNSGAGLTETDMKALADGYRAAIAKGGGFEIPAKSGGKWVGSTPLVNGRSTLGVRTFVDG